MDIRNICIIAHVDHGKTTLLDHMLKQAGGFGDQRHQADRVMDSGELEKERGITIQAKNTAIRLGETKVNIVDTPGHADFGGEVERIMSMVDGAVLLVDGAEGPLPQTRFVLEKALAAGHKVILMINKVDRQECQDRTRLAAVIDQTFDLFVELGASEEQADFPILYACGRDGWCTRDEDKIDALLEDASGANLNELFDIIISDVSPPPVEEGDFRMLVANIDYSDFVGQLGVGRILSGKVAKNDMVLRYGANEEKTFKVSTLFTFDGLQKKEVKELSAGDIALIAGTEEIEIGDTIAADKSVPALPRIDVEHPTLSMIFGVTTSPLSGMEGDAIQSRKLRERLLSEVRHNVALRFEETEEPDKFRVKGRGEFQFAILIEQMRREGLEFMIGRPSVLMKEDESGEMLEPIERAVLDLPSFASGDVTEMFQTRKGQMVTYTNIGSDRVRLEFDVPTRGLLGVRSRYLTLTKGEGLLTSRLIDYGPFRGKLQHRTHGAIVSDRAGDIVEYALFSLEQRGVLFNGPGTKVYEGMIIGEANQENDMNVNPCKEKKLTNVRKVNTDVLETLKGLRKMTLERCIEWIDDDELIEVTPESIRLRKKVLPKNMRSVIRGKK